MNVWIDLANAPHVPFFKPIIERMGELGHHVEVTFRDFNNTVELARTMGIGGATIGVHGGKRNVGKLSNLVGRALSLRSFAAGRHFDLAVSHNSYPHVVAARLLRVPSVTMMDYEGQPANHIAFRLANAVIVPDFFPDAALARFGARSRKISRYSGFKAIWSKPAAIRVSRPTLSMRANFRRAGR